MHAFSTGCVNRIVREGEKDSPQTAMSADKDDDADDYDDAWAVSPEVLAWLESVEAREVAGVPLRTVIVSGGAVGADSLWANAAQSCGLAVRVWSFECHERHVAPASDTEVICLQPSVAAEADNALLNAARCLSRKLPHKEYVRNLLRRNYCIARDSNVLFAVSDKQPPVSAPTASVAVAGGTGWTCQLFADKTTHCGPLQMYLVDCKFERWLQCHRGADGLLRWHLCSTPVLAAPVQLGAVGSREIAHPSEVLAAMTSLLDTISQPGACHVAEQ